MIGILKLSLQIFFACAGEQATPASTTAKDVLDRLAVAVAVLELTPVVDPRGVVPVPELVAVTVLSSLPDSPDPPVAELSVAESLDEAFEPDDLEPDEEAPDDEDREEDGSDEDDPDEDSDALRDSADPFEELDSATDDPEEPGALRLEEARVVELEVRRVELACPESGSGFPASDVVELPPEHPSEPSPTAPTTPTTPTTPRVAQAILISLIRPLRDVG